MAHDLLVDVALCGGWRRRRFVARSGRASRGRQSGVSAVIGANPSNSRSSPVANPSAPITTSLPGGAAWPCRMPAASSAAVFAHIVWWSLANSASGRSGQDAVEHLSRDRLVFTEHQVGSLFDDQHAVSRLRPQRVRALRRQSRSKPVTPASDRLFNCAPPANRWIWLSMKPGSTDAAAGIDAPRGRRSKRGKLVAAADRQDRSASQRNRLGARPRRIHRQHPGIFDDDVRLSSSSLHSRHS